MSNGAWLADLLNMRRKGLPDAEILAKLRENFKNDEYVNLSTDWVKENIKHYGMEEGDVG